MNFKVVKEIFERFEQLTVKHAPEILAGIGITGFVTTTVLAVKATPEAVQLIEDKKQEENVDELTTMETVKAAWKPYIPAVITGVSSTICVIGSVSTSLKRNAALATMYETSREFIKNYREKVTETIGEKKEAKIRHELNQQMVDENPPSTQLTDSSRPKGGQRFLFQPTNTYFWSTLTEVDKACVDCSNAELKGADGYIGVIECLDKFGGTKQMSKVQREILHNQFDGFGYCAANQGEYVTFSCDRAVVDRESGEFVGVIEASIPLLNDYWVYYR